jgi:hypothetical protein
MKTVEAILAYEIQTLKWPVDDIKPNAPIHMKAADGTTLTTFGASDIRHLRALATLASAGGFTIVDVGEESF